VRAASAAPPILAGLLAGCSTIDRPHAGSGWSRAPDLAVYRAMEMYGGIAREQSILCRGFRPEVVREAWRRDFGVREDAVTNALVERHGAEEVGHHRLSPTREVPCTDIPDLSWRHQYARLLRLLETRLGLGR
jgi:hypothetical protein